jgi:hypothetical protein
MRGDARKLPKPIAPVELLPTNHNEKRVRDYPQPSVFPIYILHLGPKIQIVFPENRENIDHPDFWEQTVCCLVARHFGIPPRRLANLPYCQRRARIVGNKVHYGETHDPDLLRLNRERLGNPHLVFCYDDHEKRLREDVRRFKRLPRRPSQT